MVTETGKKNESMEAKGITEKFYTMKGYERSSRHVLTSSMEDYLEMICRMKADGCALRVSQLASHLHVRPSSASKMLDNLKAAGYIDFKKYGSIMITDKGQEAGNYLLYRHQVLQDFFCTLNQNNNELELVEKIEHFINPLTIENMEKLLPLLKKERHQQENAADSIKSKNVQKDDLSI